ncbi:STAS domain-containing protein [Haliovirga abyssi]|uniref:Anti-sigma factor antagonist n=1 Tax=Haliovirga abyssi TaxID=2996794 RepID=A0AAU9DA06_9FUSO|nr:STAS domain-containing protein [Haliovirga abyssi]BDU50155.1 hypothetical protein HLVA_07240 [Haliovirga abyssi]
MLIKKEKIEENLIIRFIGKLSQEEVDKISGRLIYDIGEDNSKNVIIDFSGLEYISSLGIAMLIKLYKFTKDEEKKMIIYNPSKEVLKILNLTRIEKIIKIEVN